MRRSRLWAGAGALLIVAAAAGVAYPLWWDHRSSVAGHELLEHALHPSSAGTHAEHSVATCADTPMPAEASGSRGGERARGVTSDVATRQHPGILAIPAIGLEAPVLQGVGDAVLEVAVGHDPTSAWPGANGESLLLAHDVSYFSDLDHLHDGDEVMWIDGCTETTFQVVGHEVARPGAPLSPPASGTGLALVTCWPTDALFWTADRYVVETAFVGERLVDRTAATSPSVPVLLGVPAPPALRAEGISLDRSGVPVGSLSVTGTPSRSFSESPAPLEIANLALSDYAAAEKTAAAQDRAWWADLALPGVPLPAPWRLGYETNVDLAVAGSAVESVTLSSPVAIVTLAVRHATLYVVSVTPST